MAKVVDLFCGAGGLSLGFRMAGCDIIGGVDFDSQAIETHKLNFKEGYHFCGDISTITDETIKKKFGKKTDIVIGGPPCQGFSTANMWQKNIEEDTRNKLFFEFIRFVKILKPKAFVMENVRGILTKDNGYVKETMLKIMDEIGYNMNVKVLLASDYGVPQKRMRAFFIGIRKDIGKTFNFDGIEKLKKVTVEEAISDLLQIETLKDEITMDSIIKLEENPFNQYQKIMRENSENIVRNHNIKYPNEKVQERMKYVAEGENWKSVPEHLWETKRDNRHSSSYRRLDSKDVSITIDTGHMNYFHYKFNRVPTVRESARLQSFPDDFIFIGTQGAQFRQVGNAVPPLLGKAIATELLKYIEGNQK